MKSNKLLAVVAGLIIFNLALVSASCNEEQININEASKSELQKIKQVGPTYAERMAGLRPFEKLDELTKVDGIAEGRLETIKNQSLACVESNNSETQETNKESSENVNGQNNEENSDEETNKKPETNSGSHSQEKNSEENQPNTQQDKITLNAKDIKNQSANGKSINKSKYSQYGLVGLTILVILLFLLREVKHKKKYKNEFS